jgi:tRNA A58 N-methylase Trm61
MKIIQKQFKIGAILISILLLLQSCTIYRDAPATLDEAVASKQKVKVLLKSGAKAKYKKVIKKEELYYGIIQKDTLQIYPKDIARIQLKNKTLSIIGTVLASGVGALALIALTIVAAFATV